MAAEHGPLPWPRAARAVGGCAVHTVLLLARRRVHVPRRQVGRRLGFQDGSSATVYRETTVDRPPPVESAVLLVCFRLRLVSGTFGHRLFRWESLLNTPLFVGFPGFVSKWWITADENGLYRGLYEWDSPASAEDYARTLWWILALVSLPDSIDYHVVPGVDREEFLKAPIRFDHAAPQGAAGWWQLVRIESTG